MPHPRVASFLLLVLLTVSCIAQAPAPRKPAFEPPALHLWYWHHSFLTSDNALAASEALLDKAAALGYNGLALWDSSFNLMGNDWWSPHAENYMREFLDYAVKKHMGVLAGPGLFGESNDVLQANPNWAEGLRVIGTQFQVAGNGQQLVLKNSFPGLQNPSFEDGKAAWFDTHDQGLGINASAHSGKTSAVIVDAAANSRLRQRFPLQPWRAYHLRLFFKSSNFRGSAMLSIFDASDISKVRLTAYLKAAGTHDWTQADFMFSSQDSTSANLYMGVWGGSSGILWFDDVQIEETALVYLLRRAGAPLKMYDPADPAKVYVEGQDYQRVEDPRMVSTRTPFTDLYHAPPTITILPNSRLKPGQIVAIDSYSAFPVPIQNGIAMCMTEPAIYKWMGQNARAIRRVLPRDQGLFLGYDEVRQMNSCASCRAKKMTAGQLLDWSFGQTRQIYRSILPDARLYTWNDMFDPYDNAINNYYYVEGDLSGAWKGLPADVRIVNWNLEHLKKSLTWFSGRDPRQRTAHQQIIAGYYDSENGAAAAQRELSQAYGIPGILGMMYTTWNDNYSQLAAYAGAAKAAWPSYIHSLPKASTPR